MNDRRLFILAKLSEGKSQFWEVRPETDQELSMEGTAGS